MPTHVDQTDISGPYRGAVVQRRAFSHWVDRAIAVEFPIAGPEMILGVTPERLLVWRPALLRSHPKRFAGAVELSRIRRAGVRRRVFTSVLAFLFEDGLLLGVETMRSARLRAFASAIPTYTATGRERGRGR